jgi:hypothetical protein
VEQHPEYFKEQYYRTKQWLEEHPGYLAEYRKSHPEQVERDNEARKRRHQRVKKARADIQVAKSLQEPILKVVKEELADADIQVPILRQVVTASSLSAYLAIADIQASIAIGQHRPYASGHDQQTDPPAREAPEST